MYFGLKIFIQRENLGLRKIRNVILQTEKVSADVYCPNALSNNPDPLFLVTVIIQYICKVYYFTHCIHLCEFSVS